MPPSFITRYGSVLLTAIVGLAVLWPTHNFQNFIAQGDHGKDYYAFLMTLQGKIPYRDYWWVYGPLMPYYYALAFRIGGPVVTTVCVAEILLKLLAGIFLFLTVRTIASALWGLAAALWFWNFYPYFFFTYTHTGGIMFLLASVYGLIAYIYYGQRRFLWLGLAALFFLTLVKINIGLASLFTFTLGVFWVDHITPHRPQKKWPFYLISLIIIPTTILGIYFLFLNDLPFYILRESFPFLPQDHQSHLPLAVTLKLFWKDIIAKITHPFSQSVFYLIIGISFLRCLALLHCSQEKAQRQNILLTLGTFGLFYLSNLHEYILSGVAYRIFWATPFAILFMFAVFYFASQKAATWVQRLIPATLILLVCSQLSTLGTIRLKRQALFWDNQRVRMYCLNERSWFKTVNSTTDYLNKTLNPGEQFFALPYDPLYYFLTDRAAPVRQLMFFYNNHIPPEQEIATIQELEQKKVNYILLSNRVNSAEGQLGIFGKTHCPLLAAYIRQNFHTVATFGRWGQPGDMWASNHATAVLRRNNR